jgi:lysophospholipase L1-like esterase
LRARRFNSELAAAVSQRRNCELLTGALPLHQDALPSDGFHPNWLGYQHWATQLAGRIRELESGQSSIGY